MTTDATRTITTVNPTTGIKLADYPSWSTEEVESALTRVSAAAQTWADVPLPARVERVRRLAQVLRDRAGALAERITSEMGKPTAEAIAEVEKSAVTAEWYADNAERILADEHVEVEGATAWIAHEPVGVILAVMPWNFPVWQVMRHVAPNLAAGNAILLKHSPNVTGSALLLEEVLAEAGFPHGLLTVAVVAEPEVPQTIADIIADDRIAAVTLTGSNRAGAAVGAAAGRASKKSVLELGGSDAFVVLSDADVEKAAAAAVKARFMNSGQSCVCAKRFLVAADVAEQFCSLFQSGVESLVVGDPAEPGTNVGPVAREDLRAQLHDQVQRSVTAGATVVTGGHALEQPGYFYAPTLVVGARPGIPVFDEETFGPVAALTVAEDDDELVRLANASRFGLGLSIWSRDEARATRVARRITSGQVFINSIVASDPRVPFGGTKQSGYGRELSIDGIREFTNTRTYWVAR
ncbi:aldehyde dehydrogenase family protein [Saccharopolyspora karakumensis]|uniref:Aldehyde dehydrogenase family protein n=1 Tax=Saccharopolyspora karakumensis TaxID=2530386 RepID=A0A4R5BBM8_9PSEU|nr:aldehyde dehydrogenase family protein [Saccharopolyspora karakumensis]